MSLPAHYVTACILHHQRNSTQPATPTWLCWHAFPACGVCGLYSFIGTASLGWLSFASLLHTHPLALGLPTFHAWEGFDAQPPVLEFDAQPPVLEFDAQPPVLEFDAQPQCWSLVHSPQCWSLMLSPQCWNSVLWGTAVHPSLCTHRCALGAVHRVLGAIHSLMPQESPPLQQHLLHRSPAH